jgi:tetratricopeptide (TPR) repeat protein
MKLGKVSIPILAGVLLCCAAACAQKPVQPNATQEADVATLIARADAAFQAGDFEGAKGALRDALAIEPGNVEAAKKLSAAALYTHDLKEARSVLDAAIARQTAPVPRAELQVFRATAAFVAGDVALARADAQAGVAAIPEDYVAWEFLAYTDVIAGDYAAAAHDLSEANRSAPPEKFIHLVLLQAVMELRLGRDGRATLVDGLGKHPTDLWPRPVIDLVLGRTDIPTMEMRLAGTAWPEDVKAESRCDIYFYAAEVGFAARASDAKENMKTATEVCRPGDPELLMARAELKRLP